MLVVIDIVFHTYRFVLLAWKDQNGQNVLSYSLPPSNGNLLISVNSVCCRFVTKYNHKKGKMTLKMTDDVVCLQYETDQMQDVKRLEKLTATLMRHIVSK